MTLLLLQGVQGVPTEVHYHLHCFERVQLQAVITAPDSQLFYLLSVSRLVSVLDEANKCGVIYELQELDRGVCRGAVVGVQGVEQRGENTSLGDARADDAGAG